MRNNILAPTLFERAFNEMQASAHATACEKGWHEEPTSDERALLLIHGEVSEVMEAFREGNPPSEKIPEYSCAEEELADIVVRVMDYAALRGFNVSGAIVAKADMNKTRSHRHGGKKF